MLINPATAGRPAMMAEKVELRRASPEDRERVFAWLTASDLAREWLGAPTFADRPLPVRREFEQEFPACMFNGSRPFGARGWIMTRGGFDVGFIGQGPIDLQRDVVELQLWLAARRFSSQGIGSSALALCCQRLQAEHGVNRFILRPARRNVRALRALRRAGFRDMNLDAAMVAGKLALAPPACHDALVMYRTLPMPRTELARRTARRYIFIDSEFSNLESPELISLAAVDEEDNRFYCEIDGWQPRRSSRFVESVVMPLLEGKAIARDEAARDFRQWLKLRAGDRPITLVSDSGFDRWAVAELFGREDLPARVDWLRVPIAGQLLDSIAGDLGLRRHHALDDAVALRQAVLHPQ